MDAQTLRKISDSVTSYLGMLRQVNGYNARKSLCDRMGNDLFLRSDAAYTKMIFNLK